MSHADGIAVERDDSLFLWMKGGFYPYPGGNPISKLSQEELDLLEVEYRAEIERIATAEGVWEDTTTFFVCARK